jgi:ParB/RepB/Spo0J family partition protein
MPITNEIDFVDPGEINIGERQRKNATTEGLIDSIRSRGIWNPIIVHREKLERLDKLTLVAGHRRLLCALELNLSQVPIRYYDTLDPDELQIIELEENIKRENLSWQDHVSAIGDFHKNKTSKDISWTNSKTAEALNYTPQQIGNILNVFKELDSPLLSNADNFTQALGILQRKEEKKAADLVEELLRAPLNKDQVTKLADSVLPTLVSYSDTHDIYTDTNHEQLMPISKTETIITDVKPKPNLDKATPPIITTDFISWSESYSGDKFNLIHCDFTHDENSYYALPNSLIDNIDNFASYSCHIMFWLDREGDSLPIINKFINSQFFLTDYPLIWFKSDTNNGAPGVRGLHPKPSYESCLLVTRGDRALFKKMTDCYAAPAVTSPIVPNQKSESMLKHFLSMLVDNATDFLDICSGSGSAIRAAESLGARSVLGIEINEEYAAKANELTLKERSKRKASEAVR